MAVTFVNSSTVPLKSITMMLYPNRYLTPPSALPQEIYNRSFPKRFSRGKMDLFDARDSSGRLLTIQCPGTTLGQNVVCEIQLVKPIIPGKFTTLSLSFTTLIPERLGEFGFFKSTVSLAGGWHPYLPNLVGNSWQINKPPPLSHFLLHLEYPIKYELNHTGVLIEKTLADNSKTLSLRSGNSGFLSLIFSNQYRDMILEKPNHIIYYSYFAKDMKYASKVLKTADGALQFFEEEHGVSNAIILRLAEAYLYEDLFEEGEGIVLVSHVLYKLLPPLKTYHEARLIHGIYTYLWRAQIPWADDWIIQMLADHTSQAYLFKKLNHPLEGIEKFLKPFAFLPIVDEILYTPNPAFREIFLKEGKPLPFRENIRLYNTPRAEGTGILFKLQNLLGREKTVEIVNAYLDLIRKGEQPSFIELSEYLSRRDLEWFYQQWLISYPQPDFSLQKVTEERSDHLLTTTIQVKKEGEGIEPLTVRATLSDRSKLEITKLIEQPNVTYTFQSSSPVKIVELDPEHLTNDPELFNNRNPHQWKFLLDKFNGAMDFQTHSPQIEFGGSFRRLYDNNNIFGFYYYKLEGARGVRADYTHTFSKQKGDLFSQSTGGNLRTEVVSLPSQEDETRGSFTLDYQIGYLTYNLTFEYNQQFTGPEHPFNGRVRFDTTNEKRWSPYQTLSFITRMTESSGPLNAPIFAGAGMGLRGYTESSISGSNMAIFSLEYNFPVLYELDKNIVGLALLHTLQGKVFIDAGNASEEHNLFLFNQYLSDFGTGVHQELDLFGAYPTSLDFQIAYPISSSIPGERIIHYYLNFGVHL
ncbi:MAG: hypothetical protein HY200_05285 [Nitrospirae bacterium]|nr:hypothetical protein [Nitrospirota bacterium]